MSSRRISRIINTALLILNIKYRSKEMKIHFKIVRNYLREIYGKLKKVIQVFFLSAAQKKKKGLNFIKKYWKKE